MRTDLGPRRGVLVTVTITDPYGQVQTARLPPRLLGAWLQAMAEDGWFTVVMGMNPPVAEVRL